MKREYAEFLLNKTKNDYNLIAKDFSRTRSYPWTEIRFLFDKYLSSKDKALDLGCGNGRHAGFFKERKVDYFGLDNSEELLIIARKKFPKTNFVFGDALALPFADKFFDKVFSIAVFHQIPSLELRKKALKEVKRVLKEKGIFVLTVWKVHRWQEFLLLLKYTTLKLIGKSQLDWKDVFVPWGGKTDRYYHYFSEEELEEELKAFGFKVIEKGVSKDLKGKRKNIYFAVQKA